jgi:hypothetical protein
MLPAEPLQFFTLSAGGVENKRNSSEIGEPSHVYNQISNDFTTSGGAGAYISGSMEQLARPWLRLRMAEE